MWMFFGLSALIVVIDQIAKSVSSTVFASESISVFPFLSLVHLCNSGAAFGMLSGFRWPLTLIGCIFVGYFSWEIRRESIKVDKQFLLLLAYSLILAGAAGNLIDRVMHGCVTDFIFLHYWGWGFPVFNVADMAISFGAACWIWTLIRPSSRKVHEAT